ncbi:MAG TPA: cyclase family protein [Blastocatellia bacterium]|nr:cyclase family protein [Blastocatellia bacterium]
MKIYDISIPISAGMHVYPGDPAVEIDRVLQMAQGDVANVSFLKFGTHTGTHIDAPMHFVDGAMTVDQIPLNLLIGKVRVVEITSPVITAEVLEEFDFTDDVRVIFKTRNSYLWREATFIEDFVHLTGDAAKRLVDNGIKVVGIDYLSVEKYNFTTPDAHRALLTAGTIIIEGLNLSEVEAGDYELICLPLKIEGGDGAPARVVLRA